MANEIKYAIKLQLTTTPQHTWFSWESFISTFLHLLTPFLFVRSFVRSYAIAYNMHTLKHPFAVPRATVASLFTLELNFTWKTIYSCTCRCDFLGFINISLSLSLTLWLSLSLSFNFCQRFFSSVSQRAIWYLKLSTVATIGGNAHLPS